MKNWETKNSLTLTSLQRWINVDSGFMNPRDHSHQFLNERRHYTTQNGGASSGGRQHLDVHFVCLCDNCKMRRRGV